MTRFTLHGIFASGPTYKVGLMLNLTGTPYDYEHVDLRSGAHKADAFLAKNRYGLPDTLPLEWSEFLAAMPQSQ